MGWSLWRWKIVDGTLWGFGWNAVATSVEELEDIVIGRTRLLS